jgi:hypothetical protein
LSYEGGTRTVTGRSPPTTSGGVDACGDGSTAADAEAEATGDADIGPTDAAELDVETAAGEQAATTRATMPSAIDGLTRSRGPLARSMFSAFTRPLYRAGVRPEASLA